MVILKSLDVVVTVMAAVADQPDWTIAEMAASLGIDSTQVFRAARQAAAVGFLRVEKAGRRSQHHVHRAALLEFLIHGAKYAFVPSRGRIARGVPTAHAGPTLAARIRAGDDPVPVWPHPAGAARGEAFEPLHRCVPGAALRSPRFHDAMAALDALRGGRARERALGAEVLREVLDGHR